MTGTTTTIDLAMINAGNRSPTGGRVTRLAVIRGVNVGAVLASGYRTVMAGITAAIYFAMVNSGYRRPGGWGMAGLTAVSGVDVSCVFTCRGSAIMAAGTVAGDSAVIKYRTGKAGGVMTVFTGITALNMVRGFAQRNTAVVAAVTGAIHLGVIDTGHR